MKSLKGFKSDQKSTETWQLDISSICINFQCRDEIPLHIDSNNGRSGMDLWKILVLGAIRLNCNWDFDKVHDIANNHKVIVNFWAIVFLNSINVIVFRRLKIT